MEVVHIFSIGFLTITEGEHHEQVGKVHRSVLVDVFIMPQLPHAARSDKMSLKSTIRYCPNLGACSQETLLQSTPAPPNVPAANKQTVSSSSAQVPSMQQAPVVGVQSTVAQADPVFWKLPPAALHCTSLVVVQALVPKQHAPARQSTPVQVLSTPRNSRPPLAQSEISTTEQVPLGSSNCLRFGDFTSALVGGASLTQTKEVAAAAFASAFIKISAEPGVEAACPGIWNGRPNAAAGGGGGFNGASAARAECVGARQ